MTYYKHSRENNGIEVYFDKMPSTEMKNTLKDNYWKWDRRKKCWYNRFSIDNWNMANNICDTASYDVDDITKPLDSFAMYVRPYDMFIGKVDKEKYPDIKQVYRFEKVEEESED